MYCFDAWFIGHHIVDADCNNVTRVRRCHTWSLLLNGNQTGTFPRDPLAICVTFSSNIHVGEHPVLKGRANNLTTFDMNYTLE